VRRASTARFRNLVHDATGQTAYRAQLGTVLPHPHQQRLPFVIDVRHAGQIHQQLTRLRIRDCLPASVKLTYPWTNHPTFDDQLRRFLVSLGRDFQHVTSLISFFPKPFIGQMSFHHPRARRFFKPWQLKPFLRLNVTKPQRVPRKLADISAVADTSTWIRPPHRSFQTWSS
jgi:hypothetical protein